MSKEEILEQQVEALETLNQLKSAVIDELKAKIARLEADKINNGIGVTVGGGGLNTPIPFNPFTIDICTDSSGHEYPAIWGGIFPPCCTKCGRQATSVISINGHSAPNTIIENNSRINLTLENNKTTSNILTFPSTNSTK